MFCQCIPVYQTTKAGTTTSDTCLQGYSCLPLGGYRSELKEIFKYWLQDEFFVYFLWWILYSLYLPFSWVFSVWSSLPPIKTSSALEKQIVLAITSMDSSSLFRDKSIGADSPLSVCDLWIPRLLSNFHVIYSLNCCYAGADIIVGSCWSLVKSFWSW